MGSSERAAEGCELGVSVSCRPLHTDAGLLNENLLLRVAPVCALILSGCTGLLVEGSVHIHQHPPQSEDVHVLRGLL